MGNENVGAWVAFGAVIVAMLLFSSAFSGLKSDVNSLQRQVNDLEVASAEEIASLVVLPEMPAVDVPEFKSDQKVDELWDELFNEQVEALEAEALALALAQVDKEEDDELEDWLKVEFPGFDELLRFSEDEDEREVEVLNLGLDDEEDRHVQVLFEFKIKYDLEEGVADDYKDRVYVTADVYYDEDDEELKCEDLIYSL